MLDGTCVSSSVRARVLTLVECVRIVDELEGCGNAMGAKNGPGSYKYLGIRVRRHLNESVFVSILLVLHRVMAS